MPFMPITSLAPDLETKFVHGPNHDLESLLQTIFTVITFQDGPGKMRVDDGKMRFPLATWFNQATFDQLLRAKGFDIAAYERIKKCFAPYWKPFAPFVEQLYNATWPTIPTYPFESHAAHDQYINILETALVTLKKDEETPARYAPNPDPVPAPTTTNKRRAESSCYSEAKYQKLGGDDALKVRIARPLEIGALSAWC